MTIENHEFQCRVLIIDDENGVRKLLRVALEVHDCTVLESATGAAGLKMAEALGPELILLDLGLPDLPGMEVLRRVRRWSKAPVIVLSASSREDQKVEALDAGADDYLTKPFGVPELLARIRAALRRTVARTDEGDVAYASGDLRVDLLRRQVTLRGCRVSLTGNEYRLLAALVRNAGQVLPYERLLREMFGPASDEKHKTVHLLQVYISRLRHKLEDTPDGPRYLLTESGVGYGLVNNA